MSAVKQAYSAGKESGDKDIITAETRLYEPEIHIHINTYSYVYIAKMRTSRRILREVKQKKPDLDTRRFGYG